ncbi:MAG: OmpA family protein [Bacteroidota bacterium]|nr:OmpA family protein [Bacteroidota bacterium]
MKNLRIFKRVGMRIFFVCFSLIATVNAQSLLQKADTAFAHKEYFTAIELYQKVLKKEQFNDNTKTIYYKMGSSYSSINNYEEARIWIEKAMENGYAELQVYLLYGDMLLLSGQYEAAKSAYVHHLEKNWTKEVEHKIACCNFALSGKKSEIPYEVKNEEEINSLYSEYGLAIVKNKLVFSSSRIDEKGGKFDNYTGQGFSDIYETEFVVEKEKWNKPTKLKGGVNTKFNDGTFAFNEKSNTGYFMQCNGEKGKKENCNIFYSKLNEKNNSWSTAEQFDFSHENFSTGHPSVTTNGNTLYFVSDMQGGMGGKDIWVIKRKDNVWGEPINLGAPINTSGNEMFPHIVDDTLLLFSSDGHLGFGGLDIFYSKIKGDSYSTPENMLVPINSSGDDFGIILTQNSILNGYFCSNRKGGKGEDDIYSFKRAAIILNAIGVIVDSESNKGVSKVMVYFKGSDGSIDSTLTNSKGEFNFMDLKPGLEYIVTAVKDGFFNDSKDLSTEGVKESAEFSKATGIDLDFGLLKITKKEIIIPHIFYDFNKSELKLDSKKELDKLARILKETPEIFVQINSHTDEVGSEDYNMKLSIKRAQNVVDYLISKGVDKNRLAAKGYGESQPLKKKAQSEEDHQTNRRTTLKVIKN